MQYKTYKEQYCEQIERDSVPELGDKFCDWLNFMKYDPPYDHDEYMQLHREYRTYKEQFCDWLNFMKYDPPQTYDHDENVALHNEYRAWCKEQKTKFADND